MTTAIPSQTQMFYRASRQTSEVNQLFLDLVEDGLTRSELERNIARRPQLWGRFSSWLDKLPETREGVQG